MNLSQKIAITGVGSISSLGYLPDEIIENTYSSNTFIKKHEGDFVASISESARIAIDQLKKENKHYLRLDPTTLYAILASRIAIKHSRWKENFGINIGSSRGATHLFEENFSFFKKVGKAKPLSSPTTTLGNIASWIAQDLNNKGPNFSHSITCSSAGHAILNGVAWIQSGLIDKMLVGGSESPLSKFTIEQMKALKVYAQEETEFPCRSLDLKKNLNTMCLGEGAALFCLERENESASAYIEGIGYASEKLMHSTSMSQEGFALQKSMKMAAGNSLKEVDLVIAHAPGTLIGDQSEMNAILSVFGSSPPPVITNKWKVGHTLGASMGHSLELAILILQTQKIPQNPYLNHKTEKNSLKRILINSIGFGGNAVSLLIGI